MSIRDEFEKKFHEKWPQMSLSKKNGTYLYKDAALAWWAYQACAAHYEAERNAMLAVIAEKDAALKKVISANPTIDMTKPDAFKYVASVESARKALSIQPENCRLVEVSTVNSVAKGDKSWLVVSDTAQEPVGVDRGTQLYTIVEGEAE